MKIAICDDNLKDLSQVSSMLKDYQEQCSVTLACTSYSQPLELLSALEHDITYDLYILDILMPDITGIELAQEIRKQDTSCKIIFISHSSAYGIESYAVKATNYLLKPITTEKLFPTLNKIININSNSPYIVLQSATGLQKVPSKSIVMLEAMGRKTIYHLLTGTEIILNTQFSLASEELLLHSEFIRTHRSYVINTNYIKSIDMTTVYLHEDYAVPLSKTYAKKVHLQYPDHLIGMD